MVGGPLPDAAVVPDPIGPLSLIASVPPDGARGVAADTELRLLFNHAVDPESFVFELRGDGPAVAVVGVTWSKDGAQATLELAEPLARAMGSSPEAVVALAYELLVVTARDASGNSLPETRISFSTLRRIQTVLPALTSPDVTGNLRTDGAYGTNGCTPEGDRICIGESGAAPGENYIGFVSFSLDPLLVEGVGLESANLHLTVSELEGSPFVNLGPLQVDRVQYSSIDLAALGLPAEATDALAATASVGDVLSLDIVAGLSRGLAERRALAQFRLRFAQDTGAGGPTLDLLQLSRFDSRVEVDYALP